MSAPAIHPHPLPYVGLLAERALDAVDTVVIHCTELPDLATARAYGERVLYASGTGNSGHYYIDRDGRIEEYAPPARIAHHTRGWNARSVGIELVNTGRFPDWLDSLRQAMNEPYTDAQIAALIALLHWLRGQLPQLAQIAGHEDLDHETVPASDDPALRVRRKRDPGPQFPWPRVLAAVPLTRLCAEAAQGPPV
ncbi:MAG: N-acetylmuramoyl-L-alanine amidase [Xanthomonadales bacterium]|jgi:N-acetylmuramoyl-L-alanine amidase|nr:N-acetylmuramoyl-L-alanine amidase [Xanthomonadales bacterium]MBN8794415.1 N-acetylmuramoyl-L-alanine amidase [Stenotrophomonas nitritireducens]